MNNANLCALCGGTTREGSTTFVSDFGQSLLVVRHVPARVCAQCGEAWIEDAAAAQLETLAGQARAKGRQIEVIDLAA